MSELIKSLEQFVTRPKKRYFITVENEKILEIGKGNKENSIEISLENFKKLQESGEENFLYKKGKLIRILKTTTTVIEPELKKNKEQGYELLNHNPFWPISYKEKQENLYSWQIKSE